MAELYEIKINPVDASFQIRTELDDVQYVMRFRWNTRSSKWVFSILDSEQTPLAMGLYLNVNADLLGAFNADERFPSGPLFLWDKNQLGGEAGRDTLGKDYALYYGGE